jgi:hypothetical protein
MLKAWRAECCSSIRVQCQGLRSSLRFATRPKMRHGTFSRKTTSAAMIRVPGGNQVSTGVGKFADPLIAKLLRHKEPG